MDLLDAAAYHQLALEHAADPRARWYLEHAARLLTFVRRRDIRPTVEALTPSMVDLVAAELPPSIGVPFRLSIWQWAEFLASEGIVEGNPLAPHIPQP